MTSIPFQSRGVRFNKFRVELLTAIHMSMEGERLTRLPLNHPQRIAARDLKLQHRDEERAQRNELSRYRCPCNLCGGRRRPYNCATVARHLRHRGRHGALRGWTEVIQFLTRVLGIRIMNFFCIWLVAFKYSHSGSILIY